MIRFIDEIDSNVSPTIRAKIELRIQSYFEDLNLLRGQLSDLEKWATTLGANLDESLETLGIMGHERGILMAEVRDAEIQSVVAGQNPANVKLREHLKSARARMAEFENRFESVSAQAVDQEKTLEAQYQAVNHKQNAVTRRLDMIHSLTNQANLNASNAVHPQSSVASAILIC